MSEHEVLVPLDELGYINMNDREAESWGVVFGVEIRWDFLDRAAVSLDDAYKVGARRRQLEREAAEEQSRRANAQQQAIRDLEADLARVFKQAHGAALGKPRRAPRRMRSLSTPGYRQPASGGSPQTPTPASGSPRLRSNTKTAAYPPTTWA